MPGKIITGTPTPSNTGEQKPKAEQKASPKTPSLAENLKASVTGPTGPTRESSSASATGPSTTSRQQDSPNDASENGSLDVRAMLRADDDNDVKAVVREAHNQGYESGYAAAAAELANAVEPTGVYQVIPGGKELLCYFPDEDDAQAWVKEQHERNKDGIRVDYLVEPLPRVSTR